MLDLPPSDPRPIRRRTTAPRTVPLVPTLVVAVFIVVGAVALRRTVMAPSGDRGERVVSVGSAGLGASRAEDPSAAEGATAPVVTSSYTVAPGDTLSVIAARFGTTVDAIMQLNSLASPDTLTAGQTLTVQAPVQGDGPDVRSLPDAELVYGPAYTSFDVRTWVEASGGALATWREDVNGESLTGPEIVARIVDEFSIGPRALLAVLEAKSGIVSGQARSDQEADYPAGMVDPARHGLWLQLNWLADRLNGGFYDQTSRGAAVLTFRNGVRLAGHPSLNAGSFAIQRVLALQSTPEALPADVAAVLRAYEALFGPPPPADATGVRSGDPPARRSAAPERTFPSLTLPFARGETWWLTGGPHGGWGDGSAWSAIDFVPDEGPLGCATSAAWVTAAAAGVVVAGGTGQVILDLDGDGDRRTGPILFHLHLASDGRVEPGTAVRAGDPLGHPSCEGGFSNATHVHIARLYDGEWLAAAGDVPFDLGGWTAYGSQRVYDGGLRRADGTERAACECRSVGGNDLSW